MNYLQNLATSVAFLKQQGVNELVCTNGTFSMPADALHDTTTSGMQLMRHRRPHAGAGIVFINDEQSMNDLAVQNALVNMSKTGEYTTSDFKEVYTGRSEEERVASLQKFFEEDTSFDVFVFPIGGLTPYDAYTMLAQHFTFSMLKWGYGGPGEGIIVGADLARSTGGEVFSCFPLPGKPFANDITLELEHLELEQQGVTVVDMANEINPDTDQPYYKLPA